MRRPSAAQKARCPGSTSPQPAGPGPGPVRFQASLPLTQYPTQPSLQPTLPCPALLRMISGAMYSMVPQKEKVRSFWEDERTGLYFPAAPGPQRRPRLRAGLTQLVQLEGRAVGTSGSIHFAPPGRRHGAGRHRQEGDACTGPTHLLRQELLAQPKVREDNVALRVQEHILQLQVSIDDAQLLGTGGPLRCPPQDPPQCP